MSKAFSPVTSISSTNSFNCSDEELMKLLDIDALRDRSKFFTVKGIDVTNFVIVYDIKDVEEYYSSPNYFKPVFTHQIYGTKETIFGYRNLTVNLFYLHNSAQCLVDLKYTEMVKENAKLGVKADDIYKKLAIWLPENFCTNKLDFLSMIENENSANMFGSVVEEFQSYNRKQEFAAYKISLCDLSNPAFKYFHKCFESYIVWFIDGANKIDVDDSKWTIIYLYEELSVNQRLIRSPIGYCTVYNFWVYPDQFRSRISQFFILPTHQRLGLGTKFLGAVYRLLVKQLNLLDITVESPSPIFTIIRDRHDCMLAMQRNIIIPANLSLKSKEKVKQQLHCELKFGKQQCERICNIFYLLQITNPLDMSSFTNYVRERLHKNYKKRCFQNLTINIKRRRSLTEVTKQDCYYLNNAAMEYIKQIKLSADFLEQEIKNYMQF